MVIVAPAFERQARAFGRNLDLAPERVVVLPIGRLSPDASETVSQIIQVAPEALAQVEEGLRLPVAHLEAR